jgi:hypothetical protein
MDYQSHGDLFMVGVTLLSTRIGLRTLEAEKEQRVIPKGFKVK